MNWLLIAVLGIIVIFTYIGHKEGFIKTIFSLFSLLLAIVITSSVSPHVSKMLQNNQVIKEFVSEHVSKTMETDKENDTISDQAEHIEGMPIPKSLKKALIENNNEEIYRGFAVDTFKDYVSNYLTCVVINAVSFLFTFIIVNIMLLILVNVLNIISRLPIINGLNKTAGLFVGMFRGLVVIWLLCIVLTVFHVTEKGQEIYALINQSRLLSSIYDNNLLLKTITNIAEILF